MKFNLMCAYCHLLVQCLTFKITGAERLFAQVLCIAGLAAASIAGPPTLLFEYNARSCPLPKQMETKYQFPTVFNFTKSIEQPVDFWSDLVDVEFDDLVLFSTFSQNLEKALQELLRVINGR